MSKPPPVTDVLQPAADGFGALYHRTYTIRFRAEGTSAADIMARLQADLNQPSAQLLARFEKVRGEAHRLAADDLFQIHITGPWNGPVRVVEVSATRHRLATLEGHLEAGEIDFEVLAGDRPNEYVFRIESRARSRDRLVDLAYDKLGLARAAQTQMWDEYCRAVALLNMTEEQDLEVEVATERQNPRTGEWEKLG